MPTPVEAAQNRAKEIFRGATAKGNGVLPALRRRLIDRAAQLPDGEGAALRKKGESFLAMAEGDLRRAMWIVHEADEGYAYSTVAYMMNLHAHLSDMGPEHICKGYYSDVGIMADAEKTDGQKKTGGMAILSVNEMLRNSRDNTYLISFARSLGVQYSNLQTIADFWSDVSRFDSSDLLVRKLRPNMRRSLGKWRKNREEWKLALRGRWQEFGMSIGTYEIIYQQARQAGFHFSNDSTHANIEQRAGTCEVWTFQVKDDGIGKLLDILKNPAPVVWPLQPGSKEGTAAVTVVDLKVRLNGTHARQPYYNALKSMYFEDSNVDFADFERKFALDYGIKPENAKSKTGTLSIWSVGAGSSHRIVKEGRVNYY